MWCSWSLCDGLSQQFVASCGEIDVLLCKTIYSDLLKDARKKFAEKMLLPSKALSLLRKALALTPSPVPWEFFIGFLHAKDDFDIRRFERKSSIILKTVSSCDEKVAPNLQKKKPSAVLIQHLCSFNREGESTNQSCSTSWSSCETFSFLFCLWKFTGTLAEEHLSPFFFSHQKTQPGMILDLDLKSK